MIETMMQRFEDSTISLTVFVWTWPAVHGRNGETCGYVKVVGIDVRDEGSVAGEGRVVGVPKFHSWGKCTMPLTNINSDWVSNTSCGLCINLFTWVL